VELRFEIEEGGMFVEHGEAKKKEGKDNGESLSTFHALSIGGYPKIGYF
jgi:hypothetical protein